MLGSYRGSNGAALRIAAFTLGMAICGLAYPANAESQGDGRQRQKASNQRRLDNPRLYEPNCEAPKDSEESDLCAQREMAIAARDLYNISWWQLLVSALGLGGLIVTLALTRRAVAAANTGNQLALQTSINEGQAYVLADSASVGWLEGEKPIVYMAVRNGGDTPARWYGYRCFASISQSPSLPFDREKLSERPLTKWYGFAANSELTFEIRGDAVVQAIIRADIVQRPVRIDGCIEYETFFGDLFVSEFSFLGRVEPRKQDLTTLRRRAAGLPVDSSEDKRTKLSRTTQELRSYYRTGKAPEANRQGEN